MITTLTNFVGTGSMMKKNGKWTDLLILATRGDKSISKHWTDEKLDPSREIVSGNLLEFEKSQYSFIFELPTVEDCDVLLKLLSGIKEAKLRRERLLKK